MSQIFQQKFSLVIQTHDSNRVCLIKKKLHVIPYIKLLKISCLWSYTQK